MDALEFFFTGSIERLRSVRVLDVTRHATHYNFEPEDVKVIVKLENDTEEWERSFDGVKSIINTDAEYDIKIEGQNFILRRHEILKFISDEPGKKFTFIANLMGIKYIDDTEQIMMQAEKSFDDAYNSKKRELSSIKGQLTRSFHKMDSVDEVTNYLSDLVNDNDLEFELNELDNTENLKDKFAQTLEIGERSRLDDLRYINEFLEDFESIEETKDRIIENIKLISNLLDGIRELGEEEIYARVILEKAKSYFEKFEIHKCPLCLQEIEYTSLQDQINERLSETREFQELKTRIEEHVDEIIQKLASQKQLVSKMNQINFINYELTVENTDRITKLINEIDSLSAGIVNKIKLMSVIFVEVDLDEIENEILELYVKIDGLNMLINEKISSRAYESLSETNKLYNNLAKLIDGIRDWQSCKDDLETILMNKQVASIIYQTFLETKTSKIQEVYGGMQSLIERYFTLLHPNEQVGAITLTLDTGRRASLKLAIELHGQQAEDPRAYSSEGHLDSLGIVIFLAFIKTYHDAIPFILLDDVITTIDSDHRQKVAQLLTDEFSDKQLIITTHDNVWFEQLISRIKVSNRYPEFEILEITSWSPDAGPNFAEYIPEWERIQLLMNISLQAAGNSLRTYMENKLKIVLEKLESQIAYKLSGSYTYREIFSSLEGRLNKKLSSGDQKTSILKDLEEIKADDIYTNTLSHDNPDVSSISRRELEAFAFNVKTFIDKFECSNCNSIVQLNRNERHIACRVNCESRIIWSINRS